MRTLVVYYSRSGTTRKVAELAARKLGAEILEIRAARYGRGIFGFLRAGYDSARGRLPPVHAERVKLDAYDFVLLLAPVWAGHACTPLRAWLAENKGIRHAAAVLTCGGRAPPQAFDEVATLAGITLEERFVLRQAEVLNSPLLPQSLLDFLLLLRSRRAG